MSFPFAGIELHDGTNTAQVQSTLRSILHSMQEEIQYPSPQTANDFAGLLAALAAAKPTELPAWNDDELPHDVATLSYESALRRHARYKSGNTEDVTTAQTCKTQTGAPSAAAESEALARSQIRKPLRRAAAVVPASERDRKCASVTIRLSHAECEQLRERAAEAGLTISAYVRSCTFEAEALRAQVKQALTELRSPHAPETNPAREAGMEKANAKANVTDSESGQNPLTQGSRLGWWRRIIPDLHPARNLVRV